MLFSCVCNTLNAQDWLWAKTAGSTVGESGSDIALDASGNSYVVGTFRSDCVFYGTPNITLTASGGGATNSDIYVAKYDPTGSVLWAVLAGSSTSSDNGNGIAIDASGNSYVTGNFQGSAVFYGSTNYTLTAAGADDAFIAKYDPTGQVLWASRLGAGTGGSEFGRKIAVDGSGNSYVTGHYNFQCVFFGTPNYTLTTTGGQDIFIAKYDPSGSVLWAVDVGSAASETAGHITADASNNIYVSGTFASTSTFSGVTTSTTLATFGNIDAFVVKYDTNGDPIWARQIGGLNGELPGGISLDGLGNVYSCCTVNSGTCTFTGGSPSPTLTSAGGADLALGRYDATTGDLAWGVVAGSGGSDACNGIVATSAGYVYITGNIAGSLSGAATFYGTPNITKTSFGTSADIVSAKYDGANGNVLCVVQAGGSNNFGNNSFSIKSNGVDCYIIGNLVNTGTFPSSAGTFTVGTAAPGSAGVDMVIAKWDGCPLILPIELLNFTATQNGTKVDLKWATATETNNDYFTIERSKDGITYESVAVVKGQKNSISTIYYSELDFKPYEGLSYYRLKQTDLNKTYTYSNIQDVNFDIDPIFSFELFPNPVNDKVITIVISQDNVTNASITVYDLMGKECFSNQIFHSEKNDNKYNFVLPEKLSNGVYLVSIKINGVDYRKKMIVE